MKRMPLIYVFMFICLFAVMGSASWARRSGSAAKTSMDQRFFKDAAQGGVAEVKLGQLATQKAINGDVRDFAQRMIDDHSKANDELKHLARERSVALPGSVGAKHHRVMERLSHLSGEAFDKAYMQAMVKDHKVTVALFQSEAQRGQAADVKAWSSKTLPTLKEHLRMALEINAKLNAPAK